MRKENEDFKTEMVVMRQENDAIKLRLNDLEERLDQIAPVNSNGCVHLQTTACRLRV